MGRNPTGSVRFVADAWEARISVAKDRRRTFKMSAPDEKAAIERAQVLATMAKRLRRAGEDIETIAKLCDLAAVRDGEELADVLEAVDVLVAGKAKTKAVDNRPPCETFEVFAQRWTSGKLHRKYPDQVKAKKTAADDEGRMSKHVYPHIGGMRLDDIGIDDLERVMAALPDRLSGDSRRHVAQCMRRVLALAVYPARILEVSPVPGGFLPKRSPKKAKVFVYPSEDRKLLGCTDVAFRFRLLLGFLHREGTRTSEATTMRWHQVDLEHGTVRLDDSKTGDARAWMLGADVGRALAAWRRMSPAAEPDDLVFVDDDGEAWPSKLAREYRAALIAAGIDRPELFANSATRKNVRAHDTRATFITLALATGRSEAWVADRTGHESSNQINTYRRVARTAAELGLEWLDPLDEALPELRGGQKSGGNSAHGNGSGLSQGGESPTITTASASGGIGRRTGFRFRRGNSWRFKSSLAHPGETVGESGLRRLVCPRPPFGGAFSGAL